MRKELLLLEDGGQAIAAGGTDRDEHAAGALLVQQLGGSGDDARTGGSERVSGGQRRAVDVELVPVERAQRPVESQLLLAERRVLPRGQRGEHLRRERLVDLVEVEVL